MREEVEIEVEIGKRKITTRKAVGLGCLIAVMVPAGLLAWGISSYFSASQPAWSLAWSQDGKLLAAGYGGFGDCCGIPGPPQDYVVRIWDIEQPDRPVELLTQHTSRVLGLAFSPNSRHLASGDEWGTTLLWDLNNLEARPVVMDDDKYPDTGSQELAFSPDGQWLVGGGGSYDEVGVWNVADPLEPAVGLIAPGAYISHAGFTPDGKRVVAVSDEGVVSLWDRNAASPQPTMLPKGGEGVHAIAVSKDGKLLAGAGEEGVVWLWDLGSSSAQEAEPVRLPGKLENRVAALDFNPDGKRLITSASNDYGDGKMLVWDLTDKNKEPESVRGGDGNFTDVEFSPNGEWIAATGYDGKVRIWAAGRLDDNPRIMGK